jgi:hypothetical protein
MLVEYLETPTPAPTGADAQPQTGRVSLIGAVTCLLAAGALLSASIQATLFLTRPVAGLGLVLGLVGTAVAAAGRPVRMVVPALGAVMSGVVLVVALAFPDLLGPRYEASREKSTFDASAVRVIPLQLTARGTDGLESEGYADASRAAVQQGNIRVRVIGATVAPVQVVDSVKRYTKRPYLAVTVQVQHLGTGSPVRLVHWGTTGERTVPDAAATSNGKKLAPADLDGEVPFGVSYGQDLFPGRSASDLLLFAAPGPGASVRLELPAEMWGGRGAFRFQLPDSMISQPGSSPR